MRLTAQGLGWFPDRSDIRDYRADELGLSTPPPSHDERALVADIWDQDLLASCVAQGTCGALRCRQWYEAGGPGAAPAPEPVSRLFVWWHCRNLHGASQLNSGTYIRNAFRVLNDLGRPAESLWPHVTSDVGILPPARPAYVRKPPPATLVHGHDKRKAEYHRVYDSDEARIERVKLLSADHRFPVLGTDVGMSFLDDAGPSYAVPPPLHEEIAGGHCMFVVGYDANGAWVVNSASPRWRKNGMIHLSWEYIAWHRTRDIWGVALVSR